MLVYLRRVKLAPLTHRARVSITEMEKRFLPPLLAEARELGMLLA
jgi:hypothetical protein